MNKNYLLNQVLILLFGIFLFSCRNENNVEKELELKSDFKLIHQNSKIITGNSEVKNIINNVSNSYVSKTNKISNGNNSLTIYQDNITYVSKSDGSRESFTFFIENEFKRNKYYLENLVISKSKNQSEYQAHIVTYFFPKGYSVDGNDFKIINFKKLEVSGVKTGKQSTTAKSSGCTIIYEYTITETKHKCGSGIHSGDGERGACYEDQKPYSTYVMTATPLLYDCDGSGGGAATPEDPNNPGGGTSGGSGGNVPVDTGISLPPPCQTTDCNVVILANEINQILGLPLKYDELVYLNDNNTVAESIYSQLQNNSTQDFKNYITLKISFLADGSDVSFEQFQNWFLSTNEGQDGIYNEAEEIAFQQQQFQKHPLPSMADYEKAFPSKPNAKYPDYYRDAQPNYVVYNDYVGGKFKQLFNANGGAQNTKNPYYNTCAVRQSYAHNKMGIMIPYQNDDSKGDNNWNYILTASKMGVFLEGTYGPPTYKLTGPKANNLQEIGKFLEGKTGIYLVINNDPSKKDGAGYTGHTDMIKNGYVSGGANVTNSSGQIVRGGIKHIYIWELK